MSEQIFKISPIGKVEQTNYGFQLRVYEPYRQALNGLGDFGHVVVLWWSHMLDNREGRQMLECKKPYRTAPEKLGIFATRSPARPNPIAMTVVSILGVDQKEGTVQIPWIDAAPDTPIVDLKPYHPSGDRVKDVTMPNWCSHWPKWLEDSGSFDWDSEMDC
jgi:tRNA-Thr(GGU) m(6)t(6)A37 methyltransferase TsaA